MGYKKYLIAGLLIVLIFIGYTSTLAFFGGDGSSEEIHCLPFKIFCTGYTE